MANIEQQQTLDAASRTPARRRGREIRCNGSTIASSIQATDLDHFMK